jgi:hypothetical protein
MSSTSPIREKIFTSPDEIKQAIEQLGRRLVQVHELRKEGLQFRDALRVTAEFQIRETIREVFGDHSPEYAEHQQLRIRSNSQEHVEETIYILQSLILLLERKKADMLGVAPPEEQVPAPRKPKAIEHRDGPPPPVRPTESAVPPPAASQDGQTLSAEEAAIIHKIRETQAVVQRMVGHPASSASAAPQPVPSPAPINQTVEPRVSPQPATTAPGVIYAAAPPAAAPGVPPNAPPVRPQEQQAAASSRPVAASTATASPQTVPAATPQPASAPPQPNAGPVAPTQAVTPVDRIRRICSRFHQVTRQLRRRGEERTTIEVEDQRDVQDLLEILLSVEFDEIRALEWAPPYLDGARRTDLVVPQEGIVISVRRTRPGAGSKLIAEHIAADARHYVAEPSCKTLFCFVYDPEGRIGNPQTLEREQTQNLKGTRIEVIVEPK